LDTGFDPGTTLSSSVLALAIESGGTILVGGSFSGVLKRLNANGTAGTFTQTGTGLGGTGYVSSIAVQADGNILVGGTFTQYNTTSRNHIARLLATGSLDTSFDPGSGFGTNFVVITSMAIQADGKIIVVAGSSGFSSYNGTSRDNIVRIETTGAIDATFVPQANLLANIYAVKIQTDGKAIVTGQYNGNTNSIFNGVARFNTNGTLDNTFTPSFFQGGRSLAIQSDGKIVVGGVYISGILFTQRILRFTTTGAADGLTNGLGFSDEVKTLAIQADGKIIAAGSFTSLNGTARNSIARLGTCPSVSISTQPANAIICATNNISFTVVASGTGLSYKWQVNTTVGVGVYTDITNGGVYTGAATNTLNIANATIGLNQYFYRCLVTDAGCTSTSQAASLTVNAIPVINTQPAPGTVCEGTNTTLSISATNSSGVYLWEVNSGAGFVTVPSNANYTGNASATLNILSAPASFSGNQYRCLVGSCNPAVISSAVLLTVNTAPTITTQPMAPVIFCTGGNAQFSVIATNASTYQWQEKIGVGAFANITNAGIYGGATTNTLSLTGATITQNSNQYRCIITGANTCPSTSAAVFLNVYATPVIFTHPANSTKCAGSNTTFTVAVTSPPNGLTYQWQEKVGTGSFVNLTNGGVYSTVTAATLTLTAVTAGMNGSKYRCVVGTCASPVISFEADLIVDSPPVVTLPPLASTICVGMTTTFTTNATGLGVTFKWQKETSAGSGSYADITNAGIYSGALTETLTITNATVNESGIRYRCVVTASGICAPVNTSTALLTVRAIPTFNTQPVDKTVCEGLTSSFSSSVNFNLGSASYQWQVSSSGSAFIDLVANATLYPNGVNSSSLSVSSTFSMNGNKYRVRVGSCTPDVYSNEVTLTVNTLPTITTSPSNKTICAGENTTFSVTAVGTGLTYQWLRETVTGAGFSTIADGTNYSGATTATLTVTAAPGTFNNYNYQCRVSGTCTPFATSTPATLIVNETKITTQPVSATICSGGNQTLSVVATGPALTYQWRTNGADIANGGIYSGATTATLTVTGATSSASYQCVVTGTCGAITSSSANLNLTTVSKPVITANASNPESPVLSTSGGSTYQWFKNGTAISGATSASHTVTSEGSYTVQAFVNSCASVLSDPQVLIVTGDIASASNATMSLYPNPSSEYVTFLLGGFEKDKPVSISIIDMLGRTLEKTTGLGQQEVTIDIRSYASGKYIASLQQYNIQVSQQFMKSEK
jgi:uncharacterized delta-60 repeat protein